MMCVITTLMWTTCRNVSDIIRIFGNVIYGTFLPTEVHRTLHLSRWSDSVKALTHAIWQRVKSSRHTPGRLFKLPLPCPTQAPIR